MAVASPANSGRDYVLMAGLSLLLVLCLYGPALPYPFVFDDVDNITEVPGIRLTELSWGGLRQVLAEGFSRSRPVANLSFALNYLWGGYDPRGYRLVNLLLHALNGVLVFHCIRRILASPAIAGGSRSRMVAAAAALIWLVHPLQIQSVTYIVQRMNGLATCFALVAMVFYFRARDRRQAAAAVNWGAAALSWLLAVLSKQNVIFVPLLVMLIEWMLFQQCDRDWLRRQARWLLPVMVLIVVVGLALTAGHPLTVISSSYTTRDFDLWQRLLTQGRVLVIYLSLLLLPLPSRLNLDHHVITSTSPWSPPTTLPSLLLLAALVILAWRLRRGQPLVTIAIAWYLLNLAVESSVIGLEMMFEHRLYLPSVAIIALAADALHRQVRRPRLFIGATAVAVLLLGAGTAVRNRTWRDPLVLWHDAAVKSPAKGRPQYNYGNQLYYLERYDRALAAYEAATRNDSKYRDAWCNLGLTLNKLGRYDEALAALQQALVLDPKYEKARIGVGASCRQMGDFERSLRTFEAIAADGTANPLVFENIGFIHHQQAQYVAAAAAYRQALELAPDKLEVQRNLASIEAYLERQGRDQPQRR